jgi:hypothetical protein
MKKTIWDDESADPFPPLELASPLGIDKYDTMERVVSYKIRT